MKVDVKHSWEPHIVWDDTPNRANTYPCFSWFPSTNKSFTWYLRSRLSQEQLEKYVNLFKFAAVDTFAEYQGIVPQEELDKFFVNQNDKDVWYKFHINREGTTPTLFLIWASMIRTAQENVDQARDVLEFYEKYGFDSVQTYFLAMCFRNKDERYSGRGNNHEILDVSYKPFVVKKWATLQNDFEKLLTSLIGNRINGFRVHDTVSDLVKHDVSWEHKWKPGSLISDKSLEAFINSDLGGMYA